MVERQHRVRLAAAEVRLKTDDRLAALTREARDRGDQHAPKALRRIGDPEERRRVRVLFRAFSFVDQCQIRCELGVGEPRLEHVRMGLTDLSPGL